MVRADARGRQPGDDDNKNMGAGAAHGEWRLDAGGLYTQSGSRAFGQTYHDQSERED